MQISRTYICPECDYEERLAPTAATPDECPRCGWPKPRRKQEEAPIKPEEWPDR